MLFLSIFVIEKKELKKNKENDYFLIIEFNRPTICLINE